MRSKIEVNIIKAVAKTMAKVAVEGHRDDGHHLKLLVHDRILFEACHWVGAFEEKNGGQSLIVLFNQAVQAMGGDVQDELLQVEFGSKLAMEIMGSGVAWSDDHEGATFQVPSREWSKEHAPVYLFKFK